ncbi:MAG: pilus assembly protein PilM [Candidatus Paceibacterota bacterium]|jgi:type IV pilus assembly protein PilM
MTYLRFKEIVQRVLNINFDRAFGLDISDNSIELVELNKLIHFSVQTCGRIELPDGIIKEGKIQNGSLLSDKIKELLKQVKPARVSTNKVILSLPDTQVLTHALVLKGPQPKDLRSAISIEVTKFLPIQPSFLYWDFKTKNLPDGSVFVTFAGISRQVADEYVRVCSSIGLRVISFTLAPLAVARAVLHRNDKHTLILDIGSTYTMASVTYRNDELDVSVYIPIGGRQMTEEIIKKKSISFDEAEKLKLDSNNKETISIIEPVLKDICLEVKKVISYYESTFQSTIDEVVVFGGSSLIPDIGGRVSTLLGKETRVVSEFNEFTSSTASLLLRDGRSAALFAPVVGLAMLGSSNEFQDLNLRRQMPKTVLDEVKIGELFRGGYVSKARAVRIFFNNRITLGVMLILILGIAFIFAYQLSQYKLRKGLEALQAQPKATLVHPDVVPVMIATTTSNIMATSTATSTIKLPAVIPPVKKK